MDLNKRMKNKIFIGAFGSHPSFLPPKILRPRDQRFIYVSLLHSSFLLKEAASAKRR
jgi:hypothetical protein